MESHSNRKTTTPVADAYTQSLYVTNHTALLCCSLHLPSCFSHSPISITLSCLWLPRVLVGIEHADTAVNAVLAAYPEFEGYPVEADERLSSTAIAFLDMREGEIRDRVTETQVNLIGSHDIDG